MMMLMGIVGLNLGATAQQAPERTGLSDKNVLVAYFSCTGTTERVAQAIASETGGDLYRITPAKAYTPADLDWRNNRSRSSVEMRDEGARPELAGKPLDAGRYDVVFLGYPIWWDLCPRAVNTFLEQYDFSGKTVIPFATSGSSPITNSARELRSLYPKISWREGRLFNGGAGQAGKWARQAIE